MLPLSFKTQFLLGVLEFLTSSLVELGWFNKGFERYCIRGGEV